MRNITFEFTRAEGVAVERMVRRLMNEAKETSDDHTRLDCSSNTADCARQSLVHYLPPYAALGRRAGFANRLAEVLWRDDDH